MDINKLNDRNTLYFDESGVSSFNDKGKFFILTAVIANNTEMRQLSEYYFRLKNRFFGKNLNIHSVDFFWNPTATAKKFIPELVSYLQTIPFGFITVVINKDEIYKSAPLVNPRKPYSTKLSEAKSIWKRSGFAIEKFEEKTVKEVIDTINKFKIKDIYMHYPLRLAYKVVLNEYISNYSQKIAGNDSEFEICFETSPNRERILRYTEEFYTEKKKGSLTELTSFSRKLKESVYSISFPNKSSRYLGLEMADMISYGFNLSRYKRLGLVEEFRPIWDTISKKRVSLKNDFGIDCVIELPKGK